MSTVRPGTSHRVNVVKEASPGFDCAADGLPLACSVSTPAHIGAETAWQGPPGRHDPRARGAAELLGHPRAERPRRSEIEDPR
jgi:hypothetical protein